MIAAALAGDILTHVYLAPLPAVELACASLFTALLSIGLWRMLPRRANAQGLHAEDGALKEGITEPGRLETSTAEFEREIDARITAPRSELGASNRALELDAIERRLPEQRATEDKRRLDELLTRTNTGTVLFDSDTTVLQCNQALARLLGREAEQLPGRRLWTLLGFDDASQLRHFFEETHRLGSLARVFEATPGTGAGIWIEAHGVASVLTGRPCVMALLRDVSQRSATERMLRQRCEALSAELDVARQATAGKAVFLAKVNHELRTPLNGIIGLSEMLRHTASARSLPGSDIRKFCNNIHQSGTHLLSLVDDLIDLSRLSAGSWCLNPAGVALRAEIDAALLTVASIAGHKRIVVENACPAGLEWTLDQRAFRQIVINLVNNAVKFSPSGTRVHVAVSRRADAMALHVSDEGPGISPEDRERILTPFGRGRYAEEHKFDGVGLGLSIVSELLKLHGGSLAIDSEIGRGSTFTAPFPAGACQPMPVPVAAE